MAERCCRPGQCAYTPGKLVRVVRTSADTLIVALHDEPVLTEAPAVRLPAPRKRRVLGGAVNGM